MAIKGKSGWVKSVHANELYSRNEKHSCVLEIKHHRLVPKAKFPQKVCVNKDVVSVKHTLVVCVNKDDVNTHWCQWKAVAGVWLLRCRPGSRGKSSGRSACSRQVGHVLCSFSHTFIHWNTHTPRHWVCGTHVHTHVTLALRRRSDLSVETVAALQHTHHLSTHVLVADDARVLHVQLWAHTHTHTG